MNTLPTGVQNTLGSFAANGQLGSVTAVPGQPGTFRATVTQNGVPMEIVQTQDRVVKTVRLFKPVPAPAEAAAA